MRTFDTIRANTKLNPTTVRCPDVNAKEDDGKTPLDYAVLFKHPEIADLLREHGGKTDAELKAAGN
jgi:hypothetical protein